jgi:hypothetical protein
MQTNIRIILMATIAVVGIGALIIGSSLATAAFAFPGPGPGTSQRINQANFCEQANCMNFGENSGQGSSQSISQLNVCKQAECTNIGINK